VVFREVRVLEMFCVVVLLGSQWNKCRSWLLGRQGETVEWLATEKMYFACIASISTVTVNKVECPGVQSRWGLQRRLTSALLDNFGYMLKTTAVTHSVGVIVLGLLGYPADSKANLPAVVSCWQPRPAIPIHVCVSVNVELIVCRRGGILTRRGGRHYR
jgi:hypothetical protein